MIAVADAGPVLHLHWISCSSWGLPAQQIFVVDEVWREIERHAPAALADDRFVRTIAPSTELVDAARWMLDPGETAARARDRNPPIRAMSTQVVTADLSRPNGSESPFIAWRPPFVAARAPFVAASATRGQVVI